MSGLTGKKILFCRPREKSPEIEALLRENGAEVVFFPTFRIDMTPVGDVRIVLEILRNIPRFHWLLLSSVNGVAAFKHFFSLAGVAAKSLCRLHIGIVGKKTARSFSEAFPDLTIDWQTQDLQSLIDKIHCRNPAKTLRLLHPTSLQSVQTIQLRTPENMEVVRLPLYRTVLEDSHLPEHIAQLKSRKFDLVIFSSPTSFDYFRRLWQDDTYLRQLAIAVLGKTTAKHIHARGFDVAVVPSSPTPDALITAMTVFWEGATDVLHKPAETKHKHTA